MSADVPGREVLGLIVPKCTHNPDMNQIQFIIATLYIGPQRAGLWVSISSIMNRKQNNFKREERNTA